MARETVNLKLEAEMKAELQERARKDVRALGNLIEMVLLRYLEEDDWSSDVSASTLP